MTKRKLLAPLVLLLAGCGGGPNFAGTYSGNLATVGPCSDGSSTNAAESVTWTLADSSGSIQATFSGSCSPVTAKADGNVAHLDAKQCVPVTSNGLTLTNSITDGTFTLNGTTLAVLIHNVANFSGAASGTCNETMSGNLSKQ